LNAQLKEYYEEAEREGLEEFNRYDAVATVMQYVNFVSKSKGRRNGKQRRRRHFKDIELVRYTNGWHLWHNFKFDVYCTEILGNEIPKEEAENILMDRLRNAKLYR